MSETAVATQECSLDFCHRKAEVKAKNAGIKVCRGHYQQDYLGINFKPIREHRMLRKDAKGRVCTECKEYKTYDNYYKRWNGTATEYHATCKKCMIILERDRQERRKARGIECSTDDCTNPALSKGLCRNCYQRDYYERTKTNK